MWEENQDESDGADQEERAEKPQVMKSGSIKREKSQESADRSDVTDHKRRDYLTKGGTRIATLLEVVDEMERIIHGNAEDHRSDANHNDRNRVI